jgi:hypothetical protein
VAGTPGAPGAPGTPGDPGDPGDPGVAGPSGVYRLYYDVEEAKTITTGDYFNLATYALGANQLVNDGDSIVVSVWSRQDAPVNQTNPPLRQVTFASQSCTLFTFEPTSMFNGKNLYRLVVEIIKTGVTTATCRVQADFLPLNATSSGNQTTCLQRNLTGLNFGIVNAIAYNVKQQVANESVMTSITIDKITAQ